MASCNVCGNEYEKCFEILKDKQTYTFDCFECAIHKLAPTCNHCGCKILGHGVEVNSHYYCCAHCTRQAGVSQARDRI